MTLLKSKETKPMLAIVVLLKAFIQQANAPDFRLIPVEYNSGAGAGTTWNKVLVGLLTTSGDVKNKSLGLFNRMGK